MNAPRVVRVGSWNARYHSARLKVRRTLHRLERGLDVVALSEYGTFGGIRPLPGFDRYAGDGKPGQDSTPLDWRRSLFVPGSVTTGSEFLTGARHIGRAGPGPDTVKPKWANWVRGQLDDNGRWFRFVSFHGVPTPHLNDAREAVGDAQVADLGALVDRWHGQGLAVIAGDFNRDGTDPDLDVLEAAGMECVSTGPTHGRHTLDLIWVKTSGRRVASVESTVVDGGSSDHDSPQAALTITAAPSS